jgi:ABC-type Fe3+/spermidine/putrescine transport system ATPase subunit
VAQFIGNSNLVSGHVEPIGGNMIEIVAESGLRLAAKADRVPSGTVTALIRPERIRLTAAGAAPADGRNSFPAEARGRTYLGDDAHFQLLVDGREPMLATRKMTDDFAPSPGQPLMAYVDPADVYILPA